MTAHAVTGESADRASHEDRQRGVVTRVIRQDSEIAVARIILGTHIVGFRYRGALHRNRQAARIIRVNLLRPIYSLGPLDAGVEVVYKVELIAALGVIREAGCTHINLARLHGGQDHREVLFHGLEIESQDSGNGAS